LAAGIVHEIRNPLTAIKGFIQLMQAGYGDSQKYFGIIMTEMNRIELILSELLVLAKPQAVKYKSVHLQLLLQQVIALLGTQAIMNSIQITAKLESEDIYIFCDENQMKQVRINLLKNATEVRPSGGEIIIKAHRREQRVIIDVIDQGLGIPEEQLSKIGLPFYSTKENGTGLGILISYNIIGNHKGSIKVKSKVAVGTTFSIDLPLYNDSKDGQSSIS
jgi:signal transduction histidine kinase